jgi:hypothetical protein
MNKIITKANAKTKDGVYSYEGRPYAVIGGKLRFVGDFDKVYEVCYGFCVIISQSDQVWETKDKIKELFKKYSR